MVLNSDKDNCFYVIDREKGSCIRFLESQGLYVRDNKPPVDCSVKRLATGIKGFTQCEIERAQKPEKSTMTLMPSR